MEVKEILYNIGQFSDHEIELFESAIIRRSISKNDLILREGEICRSFYYILSGAIFQFITKDIDEVIVDLHTSNEWMYNHDSLISQEPSLTTIQAFTDTELLELKLVGFHKLVTQSDAFLQFNKVLNQPKNRTYLFDNALNPLEKYNYINEAKPLVTKTFPVKMIASYLKIAPETLSRVRGRY
ncbi:MAG: Crp/Fnr family transcriptional regulator [Chitinophagaceae bacterium]|nr:MAG: Crp/Fnr family transcriptional regulator [Chitinophagaceae bacterium]